MGKIVIERTVKPTCSDFDKKNSYFLKQILQRKTAEVHRNVASTENYELKSAFTRMLMYTIYFIHINIQKNKLLKKIYNPYLIQYNTIQYNTI